jgi:hypothetical protein
MPSRADCRRWLLPILGVAAALPGLSGCAPTFRNDTAAGDHYVTTYSRLFGLKATVLNNEEAAQAACAPDQYVVFDEKIGTDDNGIYRRWNFGCVAR